MAQLVAALNKPTLVLAPNKVLAAQLCSELAAFFPENAVRDEFCRARVALPLRSSRPSLSLSPQVSYFVSHFDYYRPESYSAVTDNYAEKVSRTNDAIDALRHAATRNLFERRDTIVVATVSCIYGLGLPSAFLEAALALAVGQRWDSPDALAARLATLHYARAPSDSPDSRLARGRVPLARDGSRRDGRRDGSAARRPAARSRSCHARGRRRAA